MRLTRPPKGAAWLLNRFGCSPNNDVVIGDLYERYRHGRSRMWYWRQTLTAIAIGLFREVRRDKARTLVAIATGWIMLGVYQLIRSRLLRVISFELNPQLALAQYVFSRLLPRGWLIYYEWLFFVLLAFVWAALGGIVGAFSGWVIAKIRPSARKPIVMAYAVSVCGYWAYTFLLSIVERGFGAIFMIPGHEIRGLFVFVLVQLVWMTIIASILFGGGLLKARVENSSHTQYRTE